MGDILGSDPICLNRKIRERRPARPRRPSVRGRAILPPVVAVFSFLVTSCDLGLSVPSWETEWIIPAGTVSIGLDEFLPEGVTLSEDGQAFVVSLVDTTITTTLGEICGSICAPLQGLTAPKPAISQAFTTQVELPDQVVSVDLSAGSLDFRLENGFSFDPIRPSPGVPGSFTVTMRSGGRILLASTIDGSSTAFPPGATLSRTVGLEPGTVESPLEVTVDVESPTGDRVRIDTGHTFRVSAALREVQLTEVHFNVGEQVIDGTRLTFETGDLDEAILSRLNGGALVLAIANPVAVRGDLQVRIGPTDPPIEVALSFLGPGDSVLHASFDRAEILRILTAPTVDLEIAGVVRGVSDPTAIRPFKGIEMRAELILTVTY